MRAPVNPAFCIPSPADFELLNYTMLTPPLTTASVASATSSAAHGWNDFGRSRRTAARTDVAEHQGESSELAIDMPTCAYRPGGSCGLSPLPHGAHVPHGAPSVTCGFVVDAHSVVMTHYPKWSDRAHGTLVLMRAAHAALRMRAAHAADATAGAGAARSDSESPLPLPQEGPVSIWVHVADLGLPELPLPEHPPSVRGAVLQTVTSVRGGTDARALFPDYAHAYWPAIGLGSEGSDGSFNDNMDSSPLGMPSTLKAFTASLVEASRSRWHIDAAGYVGDLRLHPARRLLAAEALMAREALSQGVQQDASTDIDLWHVPAAVPAVSSSSEHTSDDELLAPLRRYERMPFHNLSRWRILLDLPGGGWSGRLKYLPLLARPLIVVERPAWGWADGVALKPYTHYRPVAARTFFGRTPWDEGEFEFDPDDVLREVEWIRAHPRAAGKMARRAQRAAQRALGEEAVVKQAADALGAALAEARKQHTPR